MPYINNNPYYYGQPSTQPLMGQMPKANIKPIANPSPYSGGIQTPKTGGIGAGGVANMAGTALQLGADAVSTANEKLGLDQIQAASASQGINQAPVYTGGELALAAANAKPKGASVGKVLGAAGTGAAAGVVAGPVGAVVGAVVGAASQLIAGGIKKKKQRRERNRALSRANAAAQDFNQSDISYRQRMASMDDYNDTQNDYSRLYNLYRSQY